jgi:uncharacterized sulfatase
MLDDPSKSVKSRRLQPGAPRAEPSMGIRSAAVRWRYTEWAGGEKGVQLFDEEGDPAEAKNLAADPANAETVAETKKLLDGVRAKP